ncbi:DUF3037 domain-containing protein [Mesorhizobium sp. ASY16-5R]|uniref:DUF3037 domain-containing protein n=1 Tax=Mesorhizobium sp. ASY16-5R TaxID=3445772 RepID=UPI003FA17532
MKRQAIRYAIIRFQPHIDTQEFANVGVVLVAPNFFDFRIETKQLARITRFFGTIDPSLLKQALANCNAELVRLKSRVASEANSNAEHLFAALTKDREGVIRFSDVRTAMHDDPARKLDELFEHYIRRSSTARADNGGQRNDAA